MKISRATTILLAFGLLLMAVFVYVVLVRPSYTEVARLRGNILLAEQELARKENAIQQIRGFFQEYEGGVQVRDLVSRSFPFEADVAVITAQLFELTRRSGLALESIGYENPKVNPGARGEHSFGYGELRLKLELVGTYENFKAFIDGVEANMRLMDIKRIELSGRDEKLLAQQQMLQYRVEVSVYYQTKERPQVRTTRFQQPAE